MFGIPSLVASGLSGFFAFIGLAVVFMVSAYAIYRYFQNRNSQQQQSTFADIEDQRQATVETVLNYAVETTTDFQEQATQVLTGIQHGQEHLETLLQEFNHSLEGIQSNQLSLSTSNEDLQGKVIAPLQTLLSKMQSGFSAICEQINLLVAVHTKANKAVLEREKELAEIIGNLKSADKSLGTIGDIRKSILRYEQKNKALKDENTLLTKKLSLLLQKVEQYEEVIQQQKTLIDLLQPEAIRNPLGQQNAPLQDVANSKY